MDLVPRGCLLISAESDLVYVRAFHFLLCARVGLTTFGYALVYDCVILLRAVARCVRLWSPSSFTSYDSILFLGWNFLGSDLFYFPTRLFPFFFCIFMTSVFIP